MRKTINKPAKRKSASRDEQLPPTWSRDCSSYSSTEAKLTPTRTTGPQNLPDSLQQDSGPCEIWTFSRQTICGVCRYKMLTVSRNLYKKRIQNGMLLKILNLLRLRKWKHFCGAELHLKYYFERTIRNSWLTQTLGFGKVVAHDRFLAIWSLLHCVDLSDPTVDRTEKIYKSQPVFDSLIEKFSLYPECELSLDEGMIPTKNSLSFKQYIVSLAWTAWWVRATTYPTTSFASGSLAASKAGSRRGW